MAPLALGAAVYGLAFGVLGYFMKAYGYQLGPVILGVILSRLLDDNWRRAILSENGSVAGLFKGILTSPLSAVLLLMVLFIFFSQTPLWRMLKRKIGLTPVQHDQNAPGSGA